MTPAPMRPVPLPQDLHLHTSWSAGDPAIDEEQTVALVTAIRHARILGISDHFELIGEDFDRYAREVRAAGLWVGTEIDGHAYVDAALDAHCDYRVFHCYDRDADYRALERLVADGRPVIVAHPNALDTDLRRVPPECLVEINNQYVWRCDWRAFYGPFRERFRFVISSDAHQPHWLNQTVARYVAYELGLTETLVFADPGDCLER